VGELARLQMEAIISAYGIDYSTQIMDATCIHGKCPQRLTIERPPAGLVHVIQLSIIHWFPNVTTHAVLCSLSQHTGVLCQGLN
jgi:hypothetical protein